MIEDLQDEFEEEKTTQSKPKGLKRGAFLVIAFIFWIIYAGVVGIICAPKIIVAFRESGVRSYVQNAIAQKNQTKVHEASLCFAIPLSSSQVTYKIFTQDVKSVNATLYHDAIEGLLEGPSKEALSNGSVSFIAQGTSLRGLTVSEDVAFVDFSGEFLASGSEWGTRGLETAITQVEKTIKACNPAIKDVVIMVEGSTLVL